MRISDWSSDVCSSDLFRYRDYGNLATIGRMAAVVHLGKLKLSGALAWWSWLTAHIFFLIGFRNRLVVMLNWTWAYWSYQDRKSVVEGKSVAVRVDFGGRRIIKKKKTKSNN